MIIYRLHATIIILNGGQKPLSFLLLVLRLAYRHARKSRRLLLVYICHLCVYTCVCVRVRVFKQLSSRVFSRAVYKIYYLLFSGFDFSWCLPFSFLFLNGQSVFSISYSKAKRWASGELFINVERLDERKSYSKFVRELSARLFTSLIQSRKCIYLILTCITAVYFKLLLLLSFNHIIRTG